MNLNSERVEYLTTILKLRESNKSVSNKILSQALSVAPSSVTEMLRKLKGDGLLASTDSIELSDQGLEIAKDLISKHRLWEHFLTKTLKYTWEDVHKQAQLLQYNTGDKLFDKLNEFLSYPEFCPHGGRIYRNKNIIKKKNSLADGEIGQQYTIESIFDETSLLCYMNKLDIHIGDTIKIIGFAEFDQACRIEKESGQILDVSPKACSDIFIEPIPGQSHGTEQA